MHTALVTLPIPADLTAEQYALYTAEIAPRFQNVPGRLRKNFIYSQASGLAGGVYTWREREEGERFYAGPWREALLAKFGVAPRIEWFYTPTVVDNEIGKVSVG